MSRRRLRSLLVALLATAALASGGIGTASAAGADIYVIGGSGTVTPGLTLTDPQLQSYELRGIVLKAGTDTPPGGVRLICDFGGSTSFAPETLAEGVGEISGSCVPGRITCVYVRVVASMTLACAALDASPGVEVFTGEIALVFDANPPTPTTFFNFESAFALAYAP